MDTLPHAVEVAKKLAEYQEAKQTVEEFILRGSRAVELGNYPEALNAFSNALSINPGHVKSYLGRGYVYQELGNFELAIEEFRKALELDRKDPVTRRCLANTLNKLGQRLLSSNRVSEAHNVFTKSLKMYPDNPEAKHYLHGIAMEYVKRLPADIETHESHKFPQEFAGVHHEFHSSSLPNHQGMGQHVEREGPGHHPIFIVPKLESAVGPEERQTPGAVMLPCPWSSGEDRRFDSPMGPGVMGPRTPQQNHQHHQPPGMRNVELPQWFNRSPSKHGVTTAPFDTSMAEFMSKFEDLESLWTRNDVPPGFENPHHLQQNRSDSGYSTMDGQNWRTTGTSTDKMVQQQQQQQQQWQYAAGAGANMDHGTTKFRYHKGESSFKEVIPRPSPGIPQHAMKGPLAPLTVVRPSNETHGADEDLLISPKTHFKPIQEGQGSHQSETFNDGTSFSASTQIEDPVKFVRDESGAILTLMPEDVGSNCGSPKKYMVYRGKVAEATAASLGSSASSTGARWVRPHPDPDHLENLADEDDDEVHAGRERRLEKAAEVSPSVAGATAAAPVVDDIALTFCKKNGPGDTQNFVPKFQLHCSKREKNVQTDEELNAEKETPAIWKEACPSNEQFINDLFVTGTDEGPLVVGGHGPRSGHGFPEHFQFSDTAKNTQLLGHPGLEKSVGTSPAEKVQMWYSSWETSMMDFGEKNSNMGQPEHHRQDLANRKSVGATAMLFPLDFDDEPAAVAGKSSGAAVDDDELLLHDIHVLRELELKDNNPGEEEDESVIPEGVARSFHSRGKAEISGEELTYAWDQSPNETHFMNSPYDGNGFYPEYLGEGDFAGYGDYGEYGMAADGVPVEYLDGDLYDSMFGIDIDSKTGSRYLSSSVGSQGKFGQHMRKRNHSGAEGAFYRKQRFRGSNWAPWQRKSGGNGGGGSNGSGPSTPQFKERPCSFFLEGSCKKEHDCKFSHDLASIACRFSEEGSCLKGELCPFRHGPAPETPPQAAPMPTAHSFHFGTSPGSSLSAQFQKWRAQKYDSKNHDGNPRSFNDHRHKHKGFQHRDNHNMQGKGGFKRQRHGSASAVQREAAYVLCSESDFPSLATGPSGNETPEEGTGAATAPIAPTTAGTKSRRSKKKHGKKSGSFPNDSGNNSPDTDAQDGEGRKRDKNNEGGGKGKLVCKFISGSSASGDKQGAKQQQGEQERGSPDGFLDLDAALLSLMLPASSSSEEVGEEQVNTGGGSFCPPGFQAASTRVLAAGSSI